MAIKTENEYRKRIDKLRPNLFFGGKKVEKLNDHPISKGVIDATARVYNLTTDPEYKDIMTATSHLTGEPISRALHIHQSKEDLFKRLEIARLSSQKLGTCNYRCPGNEMLPSLAPPPGRSTTIRERSITSALTTLCGTPRKMISW